MEKVLIIFLNFAQTLIKNLSTKKSLVFRSQVLRFKFTFF